MKQNIGLILTKRAHLNPDLEGYVDGDTGKRYTFSEMNRRCNQTANALTMQGVKPGDRVAILMMNSIEFMETFFAVAKLGGAPISYGKAAIVGVAGDFEHGGAVLHPRLGKPMRAAVDGGKALIPSNVKVAAPGAVIDVPLGHKDDPWSFDHFDTMSICLPDSPRPQEIMMIMAFADGGRVNPRVGSAPVV